MRILAFLYLILVFTSCDQPKKPYIEELTWPKRTIKLDNDLGILTIRLPKEFKTFYIFKDDLSGGSCNDIKKYRYTLNEFPKIKETGDFNRIYADSLFQITISHAYDKNCIRF